MDKNTRFRALVVVALVAGLVALVIFGIGGGNKFKQPKFVKEWEVKEVVPGAVHTVLGITANKNGVFALVKVSEYKVSPPKKWADMTEKEKIKETAKMKSNFGRILPEEERLKHFDYFEKRGNVVKYRIQHFDFDGNFMNRWPDDTDKLKLTKEVESNTKEIPATYLKEYEGEVHTEDSRYKLIEPTKIASDTSGNIIVADYLGNKVVRFDSYGIVTGIAEIEQENKPLDDNYDMSDRSKGLAVKDNAVYIVHQPSIFNNSIRLSMVDLSSGKIEKKASMRPEINPVFPLGINFKIPLYKMASSIDDFAMDDSGNCYILAGMTEVFKYDGKYTKVRSFEPVLKEGFDTNITVVDPRTKERKKYDDWFLSSVGSFNSQKGASFGNGNYPSLYDLNGLEVSPRGELFVTFTGHKPFGVMEAIVYDLNGKMLGYWKIPNKSESGWFKGLNDIARIEAYEYYTDIAFHDDSIFIGKTISSRSNFDKGIIQRFDR